MVLWEGNEIGKTLLILLIRQKRRHYKICNEIGPISTDSADIKRILRDHYEQLYAYKFDILQEKSQGDNVNLCLKQLEKE